MITPFMSFIAGQRYLFITICVLFAVICSCKKGKCISEKMTLPVLLVGTGILSACLLFYFRPIFTFYGTDKSVFLYIGRMMTKGKIPYVDMFDHKGILLYFFQYLGSSLTPSSTAGVWMLEIVSLMIAIVGSYKICRLFSDKIDTCFFATFFVWFYLLSNIIEGGNFVEEWALPWITWSVYIFFRFIEKGKYEWWDIVFLGVSCSVILLLRVNMVGVWATFLPVVIVLLARKKKIVSIGLCALYFSVGIALVLAPCLLWCYSKGCLMDFWKDYILFNFSYTDTGISIFTKITNTKYLFTLFPLGMVVLIGSFFHKEKPKSFWYNLLFSVVNFVFTNISGRMWPNYLIIMLPAFILPSLYFFELFMDFVKTITLNAKIKQIVNIAIALFTLGTLALEAVMVVHRTKPANPEDIKIVEYIQKNTDTDADVLFLGNYAEMNLRTNRYTDNKYFFQYPPIAVSSEIETEFNDSLRIGGPDYIVNLEYTNSTCNWIKCSTEMKSTMDVLDELTVSGKYRKEDISGTNLVVYVKEE